ncbi:hypothetical protein BsWGS_08840 [Bradybaena similaris]
MKRAHQLNSRVGTKIALCEWVCFIAVINCANRLRFWDGYTYIQVCTELFLLKSVSFIFSFQLQQLKENIYNSLQHESRQQQTRFVSFLTL